MDNVELTDRERLIAKEAARIAIQEMSSEFYKMVGKTVIEKVLVFVGVLFVGFAVGRGWLIKI